MRYSRSILTLIVLLSGTAAALPDEDSARLHLILGKRLPAAKLVSHRDGDIVRMDLSTGKITVIAEYEKPEEWFGGLSRPWWSADGKQIIYSYQGRCFIVDDGHKPTPRRILKRRDVFEPVFWDDPETGERCIVYNTTTGKMRWPGDRGNGKTVLYRPKSGRTETLADFPLDGGLSRDGTFAGDAYANALMRDLTSGKTYLLNRGGQACHGSMSPDDTYRLMHLTLSHYHFVIRDRFDRELWRLPVPTARSRWQTPRFSTDAAVASAVIHKSKGPYKPVIIDVRSKQIAILNHLKGNWLAPHLWLPAPDKPTTQPAGPVDHLQLQRLQNYARKLAGARSYTPILDELKKLEDPEATKIIEEVETIGRLQLARAKDTQDVRLAKILYSELAEQFAGHPLGAKARKLLAAGDFQKRLMLARKLDRLAKLAERIQRVKGQPRDYRNEQFFQRNRAVLIEMVKLTAELRNKYPKSHEAEYAFRLAYVYNLPKKTDARANQSLQVTGKIVATSGVPAAAEIAPYKDSVTYVRYRVLKVHSGKYGDDEILVVHWGMRDRKKTDAAGFEVGDVHRLTVDRFNAHRELENITAAQAADDFRLTPYWALACEPVKD
ncbi:MAG: TolB family protein [Phycisphaerae bacterium]